jgi:hypothetical protein
MFRVLDNYHNQQPTRSCFLDGRYIDIVLKNVEAFVKEPIRISIEFDRDLGVVSSNIEGSALVHEGMNISRVIITTPAVSHSALVWVDTRAKTVTFSDVRRDDLQDTPKIAEYMDKVDRVINQLLKGFFSYLNYRHLVDIAYVAEASNEHCQKFGFCNAYVIKQVVDYVQDRPFDPRDIAKFAGTIEKKYSHLLDPNTKEEVEYLFGFGLGLLGGAAIASAARPNYVYAQPAYGYPYGGYPAQYGYPAY